MTRDPDTDTDTDPRQVHTFEYEGMVIRYDRVSVLKDFNRYPLGVYLLLRGEQVAEFEGPTDELDELIRDIEQQRH